MSEISPQELKARLDAKNAPTLVDVRQDWETKLCRLPNALHIPIEEFELRTEELKDRDCDRSPALFGRDRNSGRKADKQHDSHRLHLPPR